MESVIYKFTHLPTGKLYIGCLKDSRKFETYTSSSRTVSRMMSENPLEWVREVVLKFLDTPFEEVVKMEQRMIQELVELKGWGATWNLFFNDGVSSVYAEEAVRRKIEKLRTPEAREKMRKSIIAKYESDPTYRARLSSSTLEQMKSPARRAAVAKANSERVHSDETKRRLSESHKGKTHSEETKAKLRLILAEARARRSKTLKEK